MADIALDFFRAIIPCRRRTENIIRRQEVVTVLLANGVTFRSDVGKFRAVIIVDVPVEIGEDLLVLSRTLAKSANIKAPDVLNDLANFIDV